MVWRLCGVGALLVAWGARPVQAAPGGVAIPAPSFVTIAEDQGLSHSNVRALAQDQQGFIWVGTTQGGLNRFDGYEMKRFAHDLGAAGSLVSNFVWALFVDHEGTLWVGTDSGLDRFDRVTETFTHFRADPGDPRRLPNDSVLSLAEDAAGQLWVGTRGGLSRLDRKTGEFQNYPRAPTVPGSTNANSIRCLTVDPRTGLIWVGSSDGLAAFDPRTEQYASFVHEVDDPASLGANPVNGILIDPDGHFWVLTDGGVDRFVPTFAAVPAGWASPPRQEFRHFRHDPADPTSLVGRIFRGGALDAHGRLWLGSDAGLNLLDRATGQATRYRHVPGDPLSLADNFVYTVLADRSGLIWAGTVNGGLCRLRSGDKPFRALRHRPGDPDSLSDDRVTSLSLDSAGHLWVATNAGLNRYDGAHWTRYTTATAGPAGLASDDISAVAAGPQGDVWVGTRDAGLHRFDGRRFRVYRSPRGSGPAQARELPYTSHEVNDLLFDARGRLWIGGRAYGLDYYDGETFVHFPPVRAEAPGGSRPTAFPRFGYHDAAGRLWYVTEARGLVCAEPERDVFRAFLPRPEDPSAYENKGFYFAEDDQAGGLWIGGAAGLYRFDRGSERFTAHYRHAPGMALFAALSIEPDQTGRWWIGTPGGLVCFDPATGAMRTYDRADGLPANGFNVAASTRDASGRLYFGTKAGVVVFRPEELRDNLTPPPVVLTELLVLDEPVRAITAAGPLRAALPVATDLWLQPETSTFTLKFAALDFTAPEKNAYRFKLEGFDADWRPASTLERHASYTKLPPGDYVFRVKASNSDGVWNDLGAALRVHVAPPWWATWWARSVVVAAAGGLVAGGLRWRDRRARRRHDQLRDDVAARTRDLQHEVGVRQRAEAALRESHAQLEARVLERTAELAHANASLQAEIEERRKVETQLRQAQKMEAFGQLAGGVAHDFNNLLTVILAQCEVLRDPALPPAERASALEDIAAAGGSAANLTRQLLVFSRRQAMNPSALDLNSVVAGVTKLLRRIITENITLRAELSAAPLPVWADAAMLEQVLLNLAVNARDAMPQGGQLTVGTRLSEVSPALAAATPGARAGQAVCCWVTDTGHGIPHELLPRLFEPFFTTKPTGRGTGLGLATSLGIVQQHGGWIEVESQAGQGATFRVFLPCVTTPRILTAPDTVTQPAHARGAATVLLVEDQDPVRQVTRRMLERQGYRVLEADSADAALPRWAQERDTIALLLTDVVMPGSLNGRELAARLQAERPALRVIITTGYDPEQVAVVPREVAVGQVYLRKPFDREQLLSAVDAALRPRSDPPLVP